MNDEDIIQEPSPDIEGELRSRIAQLEGELAELAARGERERAERQEFFHIFPNVDPDNLPDGALKLHEDGLPLSAAYALYDRIRENELSAARAASVKNAASLQEKINGGGEAFFSADEVRGMSAREVRSNFKSIMRSMKHWAK